MTGWRRANCNCCTTSLCGVSSDFVSGNWCSSDGNGDCPDTLSVSVSLPERKMYRRCTDFPDVWCVQNTTIPAFSASVTVCKAYNEAGGPNTYNYYCQSTDYDACTYWGESSASSSSWELNGCPGSNTGYYSQRKVNVWLAANSISLTTGCMGKGVLFYNCGTDADEPGGNCCACQVHIKEDSYNSVSETWGCTAVWTLKYILKPIDSCSTACPCLTWISDNPYEQTNTYASSDITYPNGCGPAESWEGELDCPQGNLWNAPFLTQGNWFSCDSPNVFGLCNAPGGCVHLALDTHPLTSVSVT